MNAPFHDTESAIAFMEQVMEIAKDTFAKRDIEVFTFGPATAINAVQIGPADEEQTR